MADGAVISGRFPSCGHRPRIPRLPPDLEMNYALSGLIHVSPQSADGSVET
jgi:hypothetical protein